MRQLGINCGGYPGMEPLDLLPYIRDAGFDCVFTGYRDDAYIDTMAEAVARAGMHYDTIHAPFKHINDLWSPGEEGEAMLKTLTDCLDACARCDIPVMIAHLSSGENAPCINDVGHARLDRLVEHAGRVGVRIAFENQRKLANIAFVFEQYGALPQVGFCWDVGHEACFSPGRAYMPLFGQYLCALHLQDNLCEYNRDRHFIPFDGLIDFHSAARQIRDSGFTGTLMLEVLRKNSHRYDELTPEQYYARAFAAAEKLRRLVDGE